MGNANGRVVQRWCESVKLNEGRHLDKLNRRPDPTDIQQIDLSFVSYFGGSAIIH